MNIIESPPVYAMETWRLHNFVFVDATLVGVSINSNILGSPRARGKVNVAYVYYTEVQIFTQQCSFVTFSVAEC